MLPSIMKSAPNDRSPTPISDIWVGLTSFLFGGLGKILVFLLTLHVCKPHFVRAEKEYVEKD